MPPRSIASIPKSRLGELNRGEAEARDLVESLAVDFAILWRHAIPGYPKAEAALRAAAAEGMGVTRRMVLAGDLLREAVSASDLRTLSRHPSDTVRGWAASASAGGPGLSLETRLKRIRPFAKDSHHGAREWAWMVVRPAIIDEPDKAVSLLIPWTGERSPLLRRFAIEATRPRGVWCPYLRLFMQEPQRAMGLLEPLKADPEKYVQDSVANWLNDASKSQPQWVRGFCRRWERESPVPATLRICARALRTLNKPG